MTETTPKGWVCKLPLNLAATVDNLRLAPGVQALMEGESFWVRGVDAMRPLTVPWQEHYEILADDSLRMPGHILVSRKLPVGEWRPLQTFIRSAPPPYTLPASEPRGIALSLAPSSVLSLPGLMELTMDDWLAFAGTASEIRLRHLQFALLENEMVYVRGNPLPSISGNRFVETCGVATPAGFALSPSLSPSTLRERLQMAEGDTVVFFRDDTHLRIPASVWKPANRISVRLACVKP